MSYSPGGSGYGGATPPPTVPGYGQQPGSAGSPSLAPGSVGPSASRLGAPAMLCIAVLVLGVINFLLGFVPFVHPDQNFRTPDRGGDLSLDLFQHGGPASVVFLLFAGLVAGTALLDKQTATGGAAVGNGPTIRHGIVAAAAVTGFLTLLLQALDMPAGHTLAGGSWFLIILAFLQAVLAAAALLMAAGLVSAPSPKAPAGGGFPAGYPQSGYGAGQQQQQYGQQQSPQAGYGQYAGQAQYQAGQPYPPQYQYGQSQQYGQQQQQPTYRPPSPYGPQGYSSHPESPYPVQQQSGKGSGAQPFGPVTDPAPPAAAPAAAAPPPASHPPSSEGAEASEPTAEA